MEKSMYFAGVGGQGLQVLGKVIAEVANEKGLYIGRTDLPLSPAGLAELLALRAENGYPGAARFFTSPLSRCRQTLEVLYPGCRQ